MTSTPKRSSVSDTPHHVSDPMSMGDSGRALAKAAETWFAATTECQREMFSFVSQRLDRDSEAIRQMLGCTNLADVTVVQSRWVEETLRDYHTELTRLMTIYAKSNGGAGLRG